jgi:hypothetical protein
MASAVMTARRMAGSVGSGGPFGERRFLFFPLRHLQTAMLKKGKGHHRHQRVSVEAFPGSTLEVVEAEFLLHLLVCLFADPSGFDGSGELLQRRLDRQIGRLDR